MIRRVLALIFGVCVVAPSLAAQQNNSATYTLKPTPKTVAWGYYDAKAAPVLRVKSGDTVEIQTLITNSPKRLEDAGVPPDQGSVKSAGEGKDLHSFGGFDFLLAAPKKEKK